MVDYTSNLTVRPFATIAPNFQTSNFGESLTRAAAPGLAELQQASDRQDAFEGQQKGKLAGMTVDAEGRPTVTLLDPTTTYGAAYNNAAITSYGQKIRLDAQSAAVKFQAAAMQNPNEGVDTFTKSWETYRDATLSNVPAGLRAEAQQSLDVVGTLTRNDVVSRVAEINKVNEINGLLKSNEDLKNQMFGVASSGIDNPNGLKTYNYLSDTWAKNLNALKNLGHYNDEQVAHEASDLQSRMQLATFVHHEQSAYEAKLKNPDTASGAIRDMHVDLMNFLKEENSLAARPPKEVLEMVSKSMATLYSVGQTTIQKQSDDLSRLQMAAQSELATKNLMLEKARQAGDVKTVSQLQQDLLNSASKYGQYGDAFTRAAHYADETAKTMASSPIAIVANYVANGGKLDDGSAQSERMKSSLDGLPAGQKNLLDIFGKKTDAELDDMLRASNIDPQSFRRLAESSQLGDVSGIISNVLKTSKDYAQKVKDLSDANTAITKGVANDDQKKIFFDNIARLQNNGQKLSIPQAAAASIQFNALSPDLKTQFEQHMPKTTAELNDLLGAYATLPPAMKNEINPAARDWLAQADAIRSDPNLSVRQVVDETNKFFRLQADHASKSAHDDATTNYPELFKQIGTGGGTLFGGLTAPFGDGESGIVRRVTGFDRPDVNTVMGNTSAEVREYSPDFYDNWVRLTRDGIMRGKDPAKAGSDAMTFLNASGKWGPDIWANPGPKSTDPISLGMDQFAEGQGAPLSYDSRQPRMVAFPLSKNGEWATASDIDRKNMVFNFLTDNLGLKGDVITNAQMTAPLFGQDQGRTLGNLKKSDIEAEVYTNGMNNLFFTADPGSVAQGKPAYRVWYRGADGNQLVPGLFLPRIPDEVKAAENETLKSSSTKLGAALSISASNGFKSAQKQINTQFHFKTGE